MMIRRVLNDGSDQVQAEISVHTVYRSGHSTTTHGSLTLTGDQIAALAAAINWDTNV